MEGQLTLMKSSLRWTLMILCIMHASLFATDSTSEVTISTERAPATHQTKHLPPLKKVASTAAGALNEAVESAVPWRVGSWVIDQFLRVCKYTRLKSMRVAKSCFGKINTASFFKSACKATGILLVILFVYNFWNKLFEDETTPQGPEPQKNAPAQQSVVPAQQAHT